MPLVNKKPELPPLRDVVAQYDLKATKKLGQNFLYDLNLTRKIARSAGPLEDLTIVEIGPGPGGLTRALLEEGAGKVLAVEKDARCLPALADIAHAYPGRLEVFHEDALEFDAQPHLTRLNAKRAIVVANLPYNIGTQLLINWLTLEPWPPWYEYLILMFQKEVALRIVATPETRADYGRLSVLASWRTQAQLLFDVPSSAFTPPPKVTSSIVKLTPRTHPLPCQLKTLSNITQAAFGQRRKMLRQSLKTIAPGQDIHPLLELAHINPTARAEQLEVADFVRLAQILDNHS